MASVVNISNVYFDVDGNIIISFSDGSTYTVKGYSCDHTFGEWTLGIAPTCTSIGYNSRECSRCGHKDYEVFEALGHTYGEGLVLKPSVKSEDGLMLYSCTVCATAKIEVIPGIKYSEGLYYELIEDKEEYKVSDLGTCTDDKIIVPEEYEGLPVTEIGEKAFFDHDHIISIVLPDTIIKIGDKAFANCDGLEDVAMPDTAEIGTDVFRGSIKVEIIVSHEIIFVEAKEASCTEAGNVAYYYCPTCDLCYEDEEGTIRIYDPTIPITHNFIGGSCSNCGTVQNKVLIKSVDTVPYLGKFPLGTLEKAIGLPEKVNVYTADGKAHQLSVVWELSTYDKSTAGSYTIYGHVIAPDFHFADGVSDVIEAKVDIVEAMKGTADIVFVLDISGSMGSYISNVKNNVVSFAQAIEDMGVSARWSAVTYSDYADCGPSEDSKIVMNGASEWFVSASDYKKAINSISLQGGGDTPEVAIDGLMLANTLSTRSDARVFYILLTDAGFKTANKHGVSNMTQAANILAEDGVNVSVITGNSYKSSYSTLTSTTGGIMSNISGNFSRDLINNLVPVIYGEVID